MKALNGRQFGINRKHLFVLLVERYCVLSTNKVKNFFIDFLYYKIYNIMAYLYKHDLYHILCKQNNKCMANVIEGFTTETIIITAYNDK